ncbi:hypothetical protein [Paraburkholderia sp. GAS82]|uniref:hypothetical protein n=1 Tax=Paraburkholderia sp. GAS82 TaxID=3035137 RepID=UPI003D1D7527
MLNQPFSPAFEQTEAVTVSDVQTTIQINLNSKQVRVLNPNAFPVFVRTSPSPGTAAVAAAGTTLGDYPIGPDSSEVFTKADGHGAISLITTGANTGTVYVTPGDGYQSAAA